MAYSEVGKLWSLMRQAKFMPPVDEIGHVMGVQKDQDLTNTNGDLMGYNRYIHCWVVWNMIFMTFHHIGDVIIPTDEVIFFRGVGIPPIR